MGADTMKSIGSQHGDGAGGDADPTYAVTKLAKAHEQLEVALQTHRSVGANLGTSSVVRFWNQEISRSVKSIKTDLEGNLVTLTSSLWKQAIRRSVRAMSQI